MRLRHHKIRRLQDSRTNNHASRWSITEQLISKILQGSRWAIELGMIVMMIVMTAFVVRVYYLEMSRPEIILDAIDVPEDMVKLGYTGIVVAEKLADKEHKINLGIK